MSIKTTQACIESVFTGEINKSDRIVEKHFGLEIPKT